MKTVCIFALANLCFLQVGAVTLPSYVDLTSVLDTSVYDKDQPIELKLALSSESMGDLLLVRLGSPGIVFDAALNRFTLDQSSATAPLYWSYILDSFFSVVRSFTSSAPFPQVISTTKYAILLPATTVTITQRSPPTSSHSVTTASTGPNLVTFNDDMSITNSVLPAANAGDAMMLQSPTAVIVSASHGVGCPNPKVSDMEQSLFGISIRSLTFASGMWTSSSEHCVFAVLAKEAVPLITMSTAHPPAATVAIVGIQVAEASKLSGTNSIRITTVGDATSEEPVPFGQVHLGIIAFDLTDRRAVVKSVIPDTVAPAGDVVPLLERATLIGYPNPSWVLHLGSAASMTETMSSFSWSQNGRLSLLLAPHTETVQTTLYIELDATQFTPTHAWWFGGKNYAAGVSTRTQLMPLHVSKTRTIFGGWCAGTSWTLGTTASLPGVEGVCLVDPAAATAYTLSPSPPDAKSSGQGVSFVVALSGLQLMVATDVPSHTVQLPGRQPFVSGLTYLVGPKDAPTFPQWAPVADSPSASSGNVILFIGLGLAIVVAVIVGIVVLQRRGGIATGSRGESTHLNRPVHHADDHDL